jgi:hypothetical protein
MLLQTGNFVSSINKLKAPWGETVLIITHIFRIFSGNKVSSSLLKEICVTTMNVGP